jgi:hypothetical protein
MKSHSRKVFLCVVALLLLLTANINIVAQQKVFPSITYRLSMTRPVSHLFEVAIEVELPSDFNGESLAFQMPKWSPGRYAVFDFAKNVQEVRAVSGICPPKANARWCRAQ